MAANFFITVVKLKIQTNNINLSTILGNYRGHKPVYWSSPGHNKKQSNYRAHVKKNRLMPPSPQKQVARLKLWFLTMTLIRGGGRVNQNCFDFTLTLGRKSKFVALYKNLFQPVPIKVGFWFSTYSSLRLMSFLFRLFIIINYILSLWFCLFLRWFEWVCLWRWELCLSVRGHSLQVREHVKKTY